MQGFFKTKFKLNMIQNLQVNSMQDKLAAASMYPTLKKC